MTRAGMPSFVAARGDPEGRFPGTETIDLVFRESKDFAVAKGGEEGCVEGVRGGDVLDIDSDVVEHCVEEGWRREEGCWSRSSWPMGESFYALGESARNGDEIPENITTGHRKFSDDREFSAYYWNSDSHYHHHHYKWSLDSLIASFPWCSGPSKNQVES